MFKKWFYRMTSCAVTFVLLLSLLAIVPTAAEETTAADPYHSYTEGNLTFSEYTTGAEAAFDGNLETAYDGSITGKFSNPVVLSGVSLQTPDTLTDITVKGSADGVNWITLYELSKATQKLPAEFGSGGADVVSTGAMRDQMYTYVLRYVRIETASGSISEVSMFGYEVDVTGSEIGLDTSWGTDGYQVSKSYYNPPKTDFVFDHIIGADWNKGDVITFADGDETQTAYLAVKLERAVKLTELTFAARSGSNATLLSRFDGVYFEASADGTDWVTLSTTATDFTTRHDLSKYTICVLEIDDTAEYQYVRLRSDANSVAKGWLTLAELNVYGEQEPVTVPENVLNAWADDPHINSNGETSVAVVIGYQVSAALTEQNTFSIRMIGSVPSLNYEGAGLEITSKAKGKTWSTQNTGVVYSALLGQTEDDGIVEYPAQDGSYFMPYTLTNIPQDTIDTLTVRAFVVLNGERVYGASYDLTFHGYASLSDMNEGGVQSQ